jgi:4-hydroxy-tetrahydrodipicolinate synthase
VNRGPDALQSALKGVVAVLIAPYRDGELDEATTEQLASSVDGAGIHALTALGNTAEVYQLTAAERRAHLRGVARASERAVLIAGMAGAARSVLDEIDVAAAMGYDAAMLHEPSDPFGDSEGLVDFYSFIAARSSLPLVMYVRSQRMSSEALRDIAALPSVVGVKYARPDTHTLSELLAHGAGDLCTWVNGAAESRASKFLGLGLTGFTSGIANVRPDLALAVHRALAASDAQELSRLLLLVEPVEDLRAVGAGKFNVAVLKELLRQEGIDAGGVRPPHSSLSDAARTALLRAAAAWPPRSAAAF